MKRIEKYSTEVTMFLQVCEKLASRLFVTSCGGNLAWKLEEDLLLITPTKMNKADILREDLVFIDLEGHVVEGKRLPTGEMPMYIKFFHMRKDIVSIIHCHPPAVCAFAISKAKNWLMRPIYPETTIEVGPVPMVPYGEPLTEKLAGNFEPFLPGYDSFIMQNHGLVTMTREGIKDTFLKVELLEMSAQSILMALQAGEINELDRTAVRELSNTMKTRALPLFGAPGVNKSLENMYFQAGS
jgi:L-fuculose-phosphate aldolase